VCIFSILNKSKIPTSTVERNKEGKWQITARKDPTKDRKWRTKRDNFVNHQLG
jgi:hypothetical protein